jgi:hypothetical protein
MMKHASLVLVLLSKSPISASDAMKNRNGCFERCKPRDFAVDMAIPQSTVEVSRFIFVTGKGQSGNIGSLDLNIILDRESWLTDQIKL